MGHRVLGVAGSRDHVRVAVIETRLRRFELKAVHEVSRGRTSEDPPWAESEPGEPPRKVEVERTSTLLGRSLVPPPTAADSVVLAFPGDESFLRMLSFPFREKSRIEATLPFQMIGHVPVQPDEIHCAFERLPSESQGAEILGVAVPRDAFERFLSESITVQGLDPAYVSMDGVCLLSLLPFLPSNDDDSARMILWAEDDRADIVVASGLKAVIVRSVHLGEPVVHGGDVGTPFLREILLSTAAASEAGASVGRLFVAGPDADRLVGPLSEALGFMCEILDPAMLPIPGAAQCRGLGPRFVKVLALALGVAAGGGGPGTLNLRGGAFAAAGTHGVFREHPRYFAFVLAFFLLLGIGQAVTRYVDLLSQRESVIAELREFSRAIQGREREDFDAVLREMLAVAEDEITAFPAWTAVDTLNRISQAAVGVGKVSPAAAEGGADLAALGIDSPYAVEFEAIRLEQKVASLRGEAASIEILDDFIARLKGDQCIHDVVTESTERIQFQRHQGWQRFALRMAVDCGQREPAKKAKAGSK